MTSLRHVSLFTQINKEVDGPGPIDNTVIENLLKQLETLTSTMGELLLCVSDETKPAYLAREVQEYFTKKSPSKE